MSDHWIFFPCQMGEHSAFILFDYGISKDFNILAPSHLLKVRIAFKQPRADGLPTDDEFTSLSAFEDALSKSVKESESWYVGRITVDGHRHFYIYTSRPEEDCSTWLNELAAVSTYSVDSYYEPNDQGKSYWDELFPTADDWRVIKDLGVIEALKKAGDDGIATRQIAHWTYFPSLAAAEDFGNWLKKCGYTLEQTKPSKESEYCVHFIHTGTTQLTDITSHTVSLQRKAEELGGKYDGWETPVCKTSD
jgi:hypothetical protein